MVTRLASYIGGGGWGRLLKKSNTKSKQGFALLHFWWKISDTYTVMWSQIQLASIVMATAWDQKMGSPAGGMVGEHLCTENLFLNKCTKLVIFLWKFCKLDENSRWPGIYYNMLKFIRLSLIWPSQQKWEQKLKQCIMNTKIHSTIWLQQKFK
jgi:hypothetical protein